MRRGVSESVQQEHRKAGAVRSAGSIHLGEESLGHLAPLGHSWPVRHDAAAKAACLVT
jgi:hypothetical protein